MRKGVPASSAPGTAPPAVKSWGPTGSGGRKAAKWPVDGTGAVAAVGTEDVAAVDGTEAVAAVDGAEAAAAAVGIAAVGIAAAEIPTLGRRNLSLRTAAAVGGRRRKGQEMKEQERGHRRGRWQAAGEGRRGGS